MEGLLFTTVVSSDLSAGESDVPLIYSESTHAFHPLETGSINIKHSINSHLPRTLYNQPQKIYLLLSYCYFKNIYIQFTVGITIINLVGALISESELFLPTIT